MFYGKYKAKLDALSRISLPPQFLEILRQRKTEELIAHPGDHCIMLFEKKLIDSNYIRDDSERPLSYQKWFCKIDNEGKIIIPKILKEYAEIKTSVIIIGVSERIEIWSSKEWKSFYNTCKGSFEEIAEKILSLPEKAREEINRSEELSESDKEGFLRAISNAEVKELKQLIMAIFVKSEKQLNEIMRIVRVIEDGIIAQKKSTFKKDDTKLLLKIENGLRILSSDIKNEQLSISNKFQYGLLNDVWGFFKAWWIKLLKLLKNKNYVWFLLWLLIFGVVLAVIFFDRIIAIYESCNKVLTETHPLLKKLFIRLFSLLKG